MAEAELRRVISGMKDSPSRCVAQVEARRAAEPVVQLQGNGEAHEREEVVPYLDRLLVHMVDVRTAVAIRGGEPDGLRMPRAQFGPVTGGEQSVHAMPRPFDCETVEALFTEYAGYFAAPCTQLEETVCACVAAMRFSRSTPSKSSLNSAGCTV